VKNISKKSKYIQKEGCLSKFSVLMSVYHKDKSEYLDLALGSIWTDQKLKPDEIILVQDGPLSNELYFIIDKWKKELKDILKTYPMHSNKGLACALNEGLKYCSYDYIARMDSDDISCKDRFFEQVKFLDKNINIHVVGSFIEEIDEDGVTIKNVVKYPLLHKDLVDFFIKRDPLAHPTAVFRRSFFDLAGIYNENVPLAEDTLLWCQGFVSGCKFANIPIIGVKFRRTKDFYERRSNWDKSVGLLKFRLKKINRIMKFGIMADVYAVLYFCMALLPSKIKKIAYQRYR
jgi:glycosyltransferase involved in cell wall biosynthesis